MSVVARLLVVPSLVLLAATPNASADEVQFVLTVDHDVLGMALRQHLQAQGAAGVELWRSADGCGTFVMKDVAIESVDTRVKIAGMASGSAGMRLLGLCWANVSWTGRAEITTRPEIGPDWQLRLRDLDIQLYDRSGRTQNLAARLFTLVKSWSESEISTFTVDLGPPVTELSTLLQSFAGAQAAPLAAALQTIRPVGLAVEPGALKVTAALDVPPSPAVPHAPEAALTPAQIKQWEAKMDDWDGFLSFIVKDLAGDNGDPAVRDDLLALLLDARREIVDVLAHGPEPGTDAVRRIFVSVWSRLRTIVRATAVQPTDDLTRSLRYVVFLAAGDALAAIDAVAPAAGLDFSADGLRRLAKSLEPDFTGDPLQQSDEADPRLQELFRFRDPDAPPRAPRRKVPASSWNWLAPRAAHASEVDEWTSLAARLDRWVPAAEELMIYRATVDRLLTVAAERSLDPEALDERFDGLFHHLVKATAWQESCWRQFVPRGNTITALESRTGDVGLMQINVRVWRGFFSGPRLRGNAAYNAGAGAEILEQLLVRYGRREARTGLDNAARATYSAYQGGPARYRRYRTAPAATYGWAVDRAFWQKYQAVAAGTAEERVLCLSSHKTS